MGDEGRGGGKGLYGVLGVKKDCSESELRHAYKKLALKWHPDRWLASGNSETVEEAKSKFQAIHHAYSVLSDANKRFLYDVGVYESHDDDNGTGEFLNEMVSMMSQTVTIVTEEESMEDLQKLFQQMFEAEDHTEAKMKTSSYELEKKGKGEREGGSNMRRKRKDSLFHIHHYN